MTRESAEVKGRRYLTEGRLIVQVVNDVEVIAVVRGDASDYAVTYRRGGWHCECPCLTRCSHLAALMLITERPGAKRQQGDA